jgi:hypothetical protein
VNKVIGIVSLIFGVAGTCLDIIWWVQLTVNFGQPALVNTSPDTTELEMITFAVFLIMSLFMDYTAYYFLKKK